jgi:hypothetical protein
MTRGTLMGIGAWAATAAVATGVGVAAISVLGAGITDHGVRPLTSAQVERALASPATATPVPGTAGSTPAGAITRGLSTPGGSVLARCDPAGDAYLISWTPAQGYAADDAHRGPAAQAWVEFEADHDNTVTVQVTCRSGVPTATTVNGDGDD